MQENHNEQLNKVLKGIALVRPKAQIDERFKEKLRNKVLSRALELERERQAMVEKEFWPAFWRYFKPAGFALAGAACALLIVVPLLLNNASNIEEPQLANAPDDIYLAEKNTLIEDKGVGGGVALEAENSLAMEESLGLRMSGGVEYAAVEDLDKTKSVCSFLNNCLFYLNTLLEKVCRSQE